WADPYYAPLTPEEALGHNGRLELVEGRVVTVARVSGQVFLNFGPDWHSAFTVRLDREALALFRAEGVDPLALEGKEVRVRGYIRRDRSRAIMDVTHPEAIERL
ncbi:MAG TPA: thermonuclease family protein, partial [Stellaceae bacterium]|nr:thermonuclease family protein [Stellaceae bacterium]